jgi:F-type H+-transporting ATPase subunit a
MAGLAKILKTSTLFFVLFASLMSPALAGGNDSEDKTSFILHHVKDAHEWHFFDGHYGTLYLPVILYSSDKGLEVFSSSKFFDQDHNLVSYNGYKYDHGHITPIEEGRSIIDLSITKNVAMLFITIAVILFIFLKAAANYKKGGVRAPSGVASFFEPVILFVRDEIVKPNIGPKYEKFLPYMLTLFFFIWFGNILGLLPGAANLTGNIAITVTLAFFTFVITNVNGNKEYWGHIFNTPGVPWWLKFPVPIMPVVEFMGIFTKPFALLVRLFVAITAGHIVLLSIMGLTFIFSSYAVGAASTVLSIFINLIEILVATIQAYVFTLFSSMYIGQAVAEHEHH